MSTSPMETLEGALVLREPLKGALTPHGDSGGSA